MWGDYSTNEFARASQLYTATSRQLHGFKANYNLGNLQITGMYANNIEGFQRDTIVPDGTSGYYFLSKRLLVPGSEIVYVEAEEINRPGTVVERKQMLRGADYEIDYNRGTLLFRRPVFAQNSTPLAQLSFAALSSPTKMKAAKTLASWVEDCNITSPTISQTKLSVLLVI